MSLISNKTQLKVIDAVVKDLESFAEVSYQRISFEELWASNPPDEANGSSLKEFMKDVCWRPYQFYFRRFHLTILTFRHAETPSSTMTITVSTGFEATTSKSSGSSLT
jgi:hypothetical protein